MRRVGVSHHDVPCMISACIFFLHIHKKKRDILKEVLGQECEWEQKAEI